MAKYGVVIGNLGTPRSPSVSDVRSYLKEFLMDPFVIDKPYWFRALLVHGIITPLRAAKSAKAYASVWTPEGSPLLVYSQRVAQKVQDLLGSEFKVVVGMRYGEPSIGSALQQLKGCEKILLFPQYPQHADSSTTTWFQEAEEQIHRQGITCPIVSVPAFYDQPEFLDSLAKLVQRDLQGQKVDLLLMSYHGLPERHVKKLDVSQSHCLQKKDCCAAIVEANSSCYRAHCYYVSRELVKRLEGFPYEVSFQSRLGRDPWIQPFTDHVLEELPRRGIKNLAMVMPSFTVDCLETLEEIHDRADEQFLKAGGESFLAIQCLNDDEEWCRQLTKMVKRFILTESASK